MELLLYLCIKLSMIIMAKSEIIPTSFRIKEILDERHITQAQLAENMGVTASAVKQYLNAKGDNLSVSNTSKGEEWTIRSSSKTRYINFNTAGKVISWREEDPQTLRMTGKVSVSPR